MIAKLENRIKELEGELDGEQRRLGDAMKNYRKTERQIKEYQFKKLSKHRIDPVQHLQPWCPASESPHPFIAAQRMVSAMGDFDRKPWAENSYWVGSEDTCKIFPNILLACLRRQEKYIKRFMYKKQSVKERVTSWMGRAATKYHFPCAGHITIGNYDGHPGYNFLDTFQSICWSPSMLTTEVIPSVLSKTRLWVSFCLSVLAYSCTVSGKPIDGDEEVTKSVRSRGRSTAGEGAD